jgi:hypothetical protein
MNSTCSTTFKTNLQEITGAVVADFYKNFSYLKDDQIRCTKDIYELVQKLSDIGTTITIHGSDIGIRVKLCKQILTPIGISLTTSTFIKQNNSILKPSSLKCCRITSEKIKKKKSPFFCC